MKKEIKERIINRKELLDLIFLKNSKMKSKHSVVLTKEVLDIALEKARQQERERIIEIIEENTKEIYTTDICGQGCCGDGYYEVMENVNKVIEKLKTQTN